MLKGKGYDKLLSMGLTDSEIIEYIKANNSFVDISPEDTIKIVDFDYYYSRFVPATLCKNGVPDIYGNFPTPRYYDVSIYFNDYFKSWIRDSVIDKLLKN